MSQANSCVSASSPGENGQSHPGKESNEKRLAPPAWHHDCEAHPNSSPFGHAIGRHKKWFVSSLRTGPQMLAWQCPARRSGRRSDSRVYRTYGTKESRKEGRSSKAMYLALKRLRVGSVATGRPWRGVEWQTTKLASGTSQGRQPSTNPQGGRPVRRKADQRWGHGYKTSSWSTMILERRFFQVWSSHVCSEANNNKTRKA